MSQDCPSDKEMACFYCFLKANTFFLLWWEFLEGSDSFSSLLLLKDPVSHLLGAQPPVVREGGESAEESWWQLMKGVACHPHLKSFISAEPWDKGLERKSMMVDGSWSSLKYHMLKALALQ